MKNEQGKIGVKRWRDGALELHLIVKSLADSQITDPFGRGDLFFLKRRK